MPENGNRAAPVLLIVIVIAVSVAAFFGFTLKRAQQQREAEAHRQQQAAQQQQALQRATEAREAEAAAQADAARRRQLASLVEKAIAGDTAAVEALFAPGEEPDHPRAMALLLDRILGDLAYQPDLDAARPAAADRELYILPLARAADGELRRHELGIRFQPSLENPPLFTSLLLPSGLEAETREPRAAQPVPQPAPVVAQPEPSPAPAEAIEEPAPTAAEIVAARFVNAIIKLDYKAARAQCIADKLPAEKVAALCFVFEDGRIPQDTDPSIRVTAATGETAWAITKIHAPAWNENLEFGMEIEMRSAQPGDPQNADNWGIAAINLSDVLASYASRTAAEEIPYAPIVGNPNGGESLVLYFPYDSDEIHPRARRQLEIVAALLEGDADRKIRITGHADALGTLGYNEVLSGERAVEVRSFLIAVGIPASQIVTEAAGELQPLAPNQRADGTDNPEGRARNRRAEIYLDF